jgi:transketolase
MGAHSILVYTHDSIGLGEDGPTHQPIEHLTSLRAIPHMTLWRPCDAAETAVSWVAAIEHKGPSLIVLTRQALPQQQRTPQQRSDAARGGYVLIDSDGAPQCIVIATGSEVGIAADAVRAANSAGLGVRLVSMPCTEVFDAQEAAYRESVLPKAVKARVAVEAGATLGWWKYVGSEGRVVGIDRFGASGKASDLFPHFGFTADNVGRQIRELLA